MIKVGDRIPPFKLLNQDNFLVDMSKYIGTPMVIYFYPKDDTPGCTKEACSFRDEFHRFTDAGVNVFGISGDDVASHADFKEKFNLPFDLLADNGNQVRKLFGVKANLFGLIPGRVTYIINSEGEVEHIFENQVQVIKHVEESLMMIQKLGQVRS